MRLRALFALLMLAGFTHSARLNAQPKLPNLNGDLMAPTDPLSPADERKAFTVPAGFDVQLVASEPDIQKPIQMAFDAKGRLWVTSSYHYPFAAPGGKATDKLFVLSDFDANGKAKKIETFAADLNIPIGILPLPDCKSCIVSSVGEIRKYTDTDGDGKADKTEVLYSGFGSRDTHGMYNSFTLMPDGWVYACHGFNNDSSVKGKDGNEVKMQSGNTFRFRPDGSRIEVYTRGQVNPFGMAVDPWFNLYTADCHSKPITQLIPGAYYDSFGKPHDGLGHAPHVTRHDHGSTGLCGLAWYDADHFPKEYLGCMFLGNVVTNRVNADKIEWKGASPVAKEMPDLLASTDRWFRPVDIKLGPDGALYVADFYNKIIGHYEVDLKDPRRDKDRGRVWRIVWKGLDGKAPAPKPHRPDFTAAKDAELYRDLLHPNLTVRFLAGNQLIHREQLGQKTEGMDEVSLQALQKPDRLASFVGWMAFISEAGKEWLAVADYERLVKDSRGEKSPLKKPEDFTGHLVRALNSRPKWDKGERTALLEIFKTSDSVHQIRAAVEAVIFHPHADLIAPLLEVIKTCAADDTHLKLATRIALRNCLRDNPKAWPKEFDAVYADIALAIKNEMAAAYLLAQLKNKSVPENQLGAVAEHVARYVANDDEEKFFGLLPYYSKGPQNPDVMLAAFKGVQARGAKLRPVTAKSLFEHIERSLGSGSEALSGSPYPAEIQVYVWSMRVLNAFPAIADMSKEPKDFKLANTSIWLLNKAVGHVKASDEIRIGSAEVLIRYSPEDALKAVRSQMALSTVPDAVRSGWLLAFASSSNKEARLDARDALKDAPYRTAVAVGTALAGTPGGAEDLLDAVKFGKAPARLLQEKAILERLRAANIANLDKQIGDLTKGLPPLDARLAELIKKRATAFASAKPDKEAGAKVFVKHCAACHKIADMGGKIAPQLDGVGIRGLERILEDTLDPNRNVDQAFRARVIITKDEKTITGLMLRVEGEVLIVADGEGKEIRIPTKDIASNRETMLSPMPANVGDIIPEAEFMHLIAYLLDQKAKEPKKE